jgi:heme O synthase-like polyprenyltransferase
MAVNLAPRYNDLSSLAATLGLFGVTTLLSIGENSLCTENFMYTSMVPNLGLLYWAIKFASTSTSTQDKTTQQDKTKEKGRNAKGLFYASLFYLPAIILLMLAHKRRWDTQKETKTKN